MDIIKRPEVYPFVLALSSFILLKYSPIIFQYAIRAYSNYFNKNEKLFCSTSSSSSVSTTSQIDQINNLSEEDIKKLDFILQDINHFVSPHRAASVLLSSSNDIEQLHEPLKTLQEYVTNYHQCNNFDIFSHINKIRKNNDLQHDQYENEIIEIKNSYIILQQHLSKSLHFESTSNNVIQIVHNTISSILSTGSKITLELVYAWAFKKGINIPSSLLENVHNLMQTYKENVCKLISIFPNPKDDNITNLNVYHLQQILLDQFKELNNKSNHDKSNNVNENITHNEAIHLIDRVCTVKLFNLTESSLNSFKNESKAHISMLYLSQYFQDNEIIGVIGTQKSGMSTLVSDIIEPFTSNNNDIVTGTNGHTTKLASFNISNPTTKKSFIVFDFPGGDSILSSEILKYIPQLDTIILVFNINSGITDGIMNCIGRINHMKPKKIIVIFQKSDMLVTAAEFPKNDIDKAKEYLYQIKNNKFNDIVKYSKAKYPESDIPNLLKIEKTFFTCLNQNEYDERGLSKYIENGEQIILTSEQIRTKIIQTKSNYL